MYNLDEQLRNLAKSNYWQSLYTSSKDCGWIQLFENEINFSGLQVRFLYWLTVYSMLYDELSRHEDDKLTENVLKDFYRTDAYLYYRNKKNDHLWKQHRINEKLNEAKQRQPKKHNKGEAKLIEVDLRRE